MRPVAKTVAILAVLSAAVLAQTTPAPVYAESFRKSSIKVTETSLKATVDDKSPSYRVRIKDSDGKEHFEFSLTPIRVEGGDNSILSWQAKLENMQRPVFGNVLLPNRDAFLNAGPEGKAAELNPNPYALVRLDARRVFKVEGFYCVMQVTGSHRRSPEKWQLSSMDVDVQFTNTNPAAADPK